MTTELKKQIGNRIREYRTVHGMNRERFAEQMDLSPQFLADVENGKKGLSAESLYKICLRGKISADYLLFGKLQQYEHMSPVESLLQETPSKYLDRCAEIIRIVNGIVADKSAVDRNKKNENE